MKNTFKITRLFAPEFGSRIKPDSGGIKLSKIEFIKIWVRDCFYV